MKTKYINSTTVSKPSSGGDTWTFTPLGCIATNEGLVTRKAEYFKKFDNVFASRNAIRKSIRSGVHQAVSGKGFSFLAPIASYLELPTAYVSLTSTRRSILITNLDHQQATHIEAAMLLMSTGRVRGEINMFIPSEKERWMGQAAYNLQQVSGYNGKYVVAAEYYAGDREQGMSLQKSRDYIRDTILTHDTEENREVRAKLDRWLDVSPNLCLLYTINNQGTGHQRETSSLSGWLGKQDKWLKL
jgi:hypothetical protein